MTTSLKTTITGIVGAVAMIVNLFLKTEIPQDAIIAVTLFFIGLFAKDSNVTGGTVSNSETPAK
jgi:hypothetical protein